MLLENRPSPRATARRPTSALVRVARVAQPTSAKVAVFNAKSIGNKLAAICDSITVEKPCFCAIVETWHDSADCLSLIACTPPGYYCLERARPRSTAHVNSMSINHGGICLLYASRYGARAVSLSVYETFKVLAVYLHGAGLNMLVVVIYRPNFTAIGSTFFDEFDDALERTATFSSAIAIVGDINIHLDVMNDPNTIKFVRSLDDHNLVQHVFGPTHRDGHTLDVLITRSNARAPALVVEEPKLFSSDHSFISITLDLQHDDDKPVAKTGGVISTRTASPTTSCVRN